MDSKSKIILIAVLIFVLAAAFLATEKCDNDPTGHIIAVDNLENEQSQEPASEPPIWHNGSGQPTMTPTGGADEGAQDEVDDHQQDDPYCGDGECNGRENCARCQQDCGCEDPALCLDGTCVEVTCRSDEDCVDDDPCSIDTCFYPGHPNSYCSDEMITRPIHRDGCCPPGAYMDVDIDCPPVCGNGRCEMGEHTEDCREDCLNAGPSGGGDDGGSSGGQTAGGPY